MGKGHKHHKLHQGNASSPTQPSKNFTRTEPKPVLSSPRSLARQIGLQFAALLGLSAALGFTFNAANPIGVRFAKAATTPAPVVSGKTNFSLTSTSGVVKAAGTSAPPGPQSVRPAAILPPAPRLPPAPTNVPKPAVAVPSTAPATNQLPVVISPPAQTNLNPAPLHWREAKPLVASGSALLVDVRMAAVYDAGHIPDAISLPESSTSEEIKAFLKLVPTNLTLIVYCSSTSCSQSKRVATRLVSEFHYPVVKYMTGGYQEYQQEELAHSQSNPQQHADR